MGAQQISGTLDSGFDNVVFGENSITYEQVFVSLGKGVNARAAFGFMFSEHLGAEVGIGYLMGNKTTATTEDPGDDELTENQISANMVRINPNVMITAGLEKINPYAKFGIIVGAGSIKYRTEVMDSGIASTAEAKFDGGIAIGLSSALGANFNLSNNATIFVELNMVNMAYGPTKGEIIELTEDGEDELPDLTVNEKEVELVKEYTRDLSEPLSDDEPEQALKIKFPFGSVGLNIGARFSF